MKLKTYLKKQKISVYEFSVKSGIRTELLYAYFNRSNPSLKNAVKINKITGGSVGFKDMLVNK